MSGLFLLTAGFLVAGLVIAMFLPEAPLREQRDADARDPGRPDDDEVAGASERATQRAPRVSV